MRASGMDDIRVEIVQSKRRKKTVAARMINETTMRLYAPKHLSAKDLEQYVHDFKQRFAKKRRREELNKTAYLPRRAQELNERYFAGALTIRSIAYVTNQASQYGSCSCHEGTIRIADCVADMPVWVRDYIIVHELAHLVEPSHNARFRDLVDQYPLAERARGFLIAKGLEREEDGELNTDESIAHSDMCDHGELPLWIERYKGDRDMDREEGVV